MRYRLLDKSVKMVFLVYILTVKRRVGGGQTYVAFDRLIQYFKMLVLIVINWGNNVELSDKFDHVIWELKGFIAV